MKASSMRRVTKCLVLFASLSLAPIHYASAAGGIVRVADGDCAGLKVAIANAQVYRPTSIVLASRGTYGYCPISVTGSVDIDGAGASWGLMYSDTTPDIYIGASAHLTIRNLNFVSAGDPKSDYGLRTCGGGRFPPVPCYGPLFEYPLVTNNGTLILDSVSASGVVFAWNGFITNAGQLVLRNATFANNRSDVYGSLIYMFTTSSNEIEHSTFASNSIGFTFDSTEGTVSSVISNSVVDGSCDTILLPPMNSFPISHGGNVFNYVSNPELGSCHFSGPGDQAVSDFKFADLGKHGGVVDTLALSYYSPAKGAGLAANCEATDARGVARGQSHCDAGAYEYGGGEGRLSASGASGLYFDAAHDGHYVTVQRLDGGDALVIWNTFDANGTPAWLYGIGPVSGNTIHVGQVSQNLGGKLQLGGTVIGSKETAWGSFDFTASDCGAAALAYNSPHPTFGTGSVNLTRLALINGLECSQ